MLTHCTRAALITAAIAALTPALEAQSYLTPPQVIVDILDAPPTPAVTLSPDHQVIALLERRSMPTIAELSQPVHRLAGARINPKTNGRQQRVGAGIGITLKSIASNTDKKLALPSGVNVGGLIFSPDGKRLAFLNTKSDGHTEQHKGREHGTA